MNAQQLETAIKENAKANFNLYSEDYPIQSGLATEEAVNAYGVLADGYWENKTELDEVEGVTQYEYREWVAEAFETWVQDKIERLKKDAIELLVGLYRRTVYNSEYYRTQTFFDDYVHNSCQLGAYVKDSLTDDELKEIAYNFITYDGGQYLLSSK